jgi:hypothetical protein
MDRINLLGAVTTVGYFSSMSLIFALRMLGKTQYGRMLGLLQTVLAILAMATLVFAAWRFDRPSLYRIQVSLFLIFLIVELLIDYILKIDFRQVRWMVITYVTFFFAATGGMIGVASSAGSGWMVTAVILYLVMAVLAFVSRAVTGI